MTPANTFTALVFVFTLLIVLESLQKIVFLSLWFSISIFTVCYFIMFISVLLLRIIVLSVTLYYVNKPF